MANAVARYFPSCPQLPGLCLFLQSPWQIQLQPIVILRSPCKLQQVNNSFSYAAFQLTQASPAALSAWSLSNKLWLVSAISKFYQTLSLFLHLKYVVIEVFLPNRSFSRLVSLTSWFSPVCERT